MPRRVFFSFHYDRDIRRVVQIRNSWRIRAHGESQPFLDKAKWESVRLGGDRAIKNWIDRQLEGTSVTVVLIGAETASREYVKYEIKQSYLRGKGLLGIYINNVKDPHEGTDIKGESPFDLLYLKDGPARVYLSEVCDTYDWVRDDGYNNLSKWIDKAARDAGR